MTTRTPKTLMTAGLFGLTLFLSAGLMFAVQPMIGKMLLPLVGGTPAGWVVAMAFFQVALLAGYFVAHFFSRFSPKNHAFLYIALLGLGCAFLPVGLAAPADGATPDGVDIFIMLLTSIAVPFIALSATSSTIQRLFTTTDHPSADDPYFLYAASNLGSFIGLFAYPLALEPFVGLAAQTKFWFVLYAVLIGLSLVCTTMSKSKAEKAAAAPQPAAAQPLPGRRKLEWILLAFVPSSLLLGVTTHISTNIFSAPMIWVLPLSLYLLTFVFAFAKGSARSLPFLTAAHPAAVLGVVALTILSMSGFLLSWKSVFLHMCVFSLIALFCHTRLASLRPQDNRHLTEFYLMLSIGGALGGLLNAFIIPYTLNTLSEYPIMALLSLLLSPDIRKKIPRPQLLVFLGTAMVCLAIYAACLSGNLEGVFPKAYTVPMIANVVILVAFTLTLVNARLALTTGALFFALFQFVPPYDVVFMTRNFYGVIRVQDRPAIDEYNLAIRQISHGTTIHGMQALDKKLANRTMSYYGPGSGFHDAFTSQNPDKIAIIGLGAGVQNCLTSPRREFTFIDIDPGMVEAAQNYFTFLSACKNKKPPEIIIGDGRLEIEKMTDRKFDMIVLDAFSGDAVPTHLLTIEALNSYFDRLEKDGLLVLHISNRYFDLGPVVTRNAGEIGAAVAAKVYSPKKITTLNVPSYWIVLSKSEKAMNRFVSKGGWAVPTVTDNTQIWTDDHNSLITTLIQLNSQSLKTLHAKGK